MNNKFDKNLLNILICPKCKGELHYNEPSKQLECFKCNLAYQIIDNIPNMLIDEAIKIEDGQNN